MLSLITSGVYWLLIGLWTYILVFCLRRLYRTGEATGFVRLVLLILLIDAGRTLVESVYFGTWYTARSGLLPVWIYHTLERPELVFIPKIINLIAAAVLVGLIMRRWIPQEEEEAHALEVAVNERTVELSQTNAKLRQSEERYRALATAAPVGIFRTDPQGNCVYVNDRWCEIAGLTLEEALGAGWVSGLDPDDRERVARAWYQAAQDDVLFQEEYRFRTPDGIATWVFGQAAAERDDAGNVTGYVGTITDITEQKRGEQGRLALERQIQHAQKLESLGVLAGGIAHDFNNLLTGILGSAELATLALPPESPAGRHVEGIRQSALHAAELTRQMLAYSGKGRFVVEVLDLGNLVQGIAHLLEATLPKGVVLKVHAAPGLPAVEADAAQMRQVIMNLIINAGEAIGDRDGTVTVSVGDQTVDEAYLAQLNLTEPLTPGAYVYLEVADTGAGMEADMVDMIFDPFFTTKFQGRGLGLAAVQGIVRGHHGALKVYSEVGRGTTFKVLLPAATGLPGAPERAAAMESDTWRGSGTVLVIDDEARVRDYAEQALTYLGFAVLTAEDGRAGADLFRDRAEEITLVLLDMTMPHLSGTDVFEAIRALRPDVPVILCSGYNEQETTSRFAGKGLAGFVQKPYRIQTLVAALRTALGT